MPCPLVGLQQLLRRLASQSDIGGSRNRERLRGRIAQKDFDSGTETEVGFVAIPHLPGLHVRNDMHAFTHKFVPQGSRGRRSPHAESCTHSDDDGRDPLPKWNTMATVQLHDSASPVSSMPPPGFDSLACKSISWSHFRSRLRQVPPLMTVLLIVNTVPPFSKNDPHMPVAAKPECMVQKARGQADSSWERVVAQPVKRSNPIPPIEPPSEP